MTGQLLGLYTKHGKNPKNFVTNYNPQNLFLLAKQKMHYLEACLNCKGLNKTELRQAIKELSLIIAIFETDRFINLNDKQIKYFLRLTADALNDCSAIGSATHETMVLALR